MSRNNWIHISLAILVALAALFLIRLHNASGTTDASDSASAGHRLAEAWCTACHAIEGNPVGASSAAPGFVQIARPPSTTEPALRRRGTPRRPKHAKSRADAGSVRRPRQLYPQPETQLIPAIGVPPPRSRRRSQSCAAPFRRAAAPPSGRRAGSRRARRFPAAQTQR